MGEEIERKFLVEKTPRDINSHPHEEIRQGYLELSDDSELRIRRYGNRHSQTRKSGSGLSREEVEKAIPKEEFDSLWPETRGARIHKTRYEIGYGGHVIELDIYHGALDGLVMAEVEFPNIEASKEFLTPVWFGEEVTEDERYKNKNLALDGIPE